MTHGFFSRGFVSLIFVDTADRRRRVGSGLFDEFEGRCGSSRIFTPANLSKECPSRPSKPAMKTSLGLTAAMAVPE